jgi:hypothetical protein
MARAYGNVPGWPPGHGPNRVPVVQRPRRGHRRRIRWSVVWVLGALFLSVWIINSVAPSITWGGVMDGLHIRNREGFSRLACLFLVLVAVLLIARIARKRRRE